MNLLLVDDEPLALQDLEDAVRAALPRADIHSFGKAREALAYGRENPVDIAFLDIQMRVFDGLTLAQELVRVWPEVNIIFCTGFSEYSLEAHDLYCSAYLMKPITMEKLRAALNHLRHPVAVSPEVVIRCFGDFEVFYQGRPVEFGRKKTKELLAYLVDRNGTDCSARQIMAALFERDNLNYYSSLRRDLLDTFQALGVPEVIRTAYGTIRIDRDAVRCDYFDYLDGRGEAFLGEYMTQYSFGEETCGMLKKMSAPENFSKK